MMGITRINGHKSGFKTYHAFFERAGNTVGSAVVKASSRLGAVAKFDRIGKQRHGTAGYELKRIRVV